MQQGFKSFAECLAYLAQFTDYEKMSRIKYAQSTYNLERMRRLLSTVGDPHLKVPVIHVTGTKGKGSTAWMLHYLLRAHGFSCGLYTSPHLVSLLERIHINEADATEADFLAAMNVLYPSLVEMYREAELARPTFFEIVTAAAFLIFAEKKVDFSVIEVGVGGRLDATNVVQPVACLITLIDYDHMDKLGNTLAQIASEKAGIIKPSAPAVTGERGEEAFPVIEEAAKRCGVPLFVLGRDFQVEAGPGGMFAVKTWRRTYDGLSLPVPGRHQRTNAALAVAVLECLASQKLVSPSPEAVRRAFAALSLPGRIELFHPDPAGPFIVVDGAHNPVSMRALAETLPELCKTASEGKAGASPPPIVLVIGMSEDKQIEETLREILSHVGTVFFTAAANPRAARPERLRDAAARMGYVGKVVCVDTPREALRQAVACAGRDGLVIVTGSFYVAGDVLGILRNSKF